MSDSPRATSGRSRVNANRPSPSIRGTAHAQFAEGSFSGMSRLNVHQQDMQKYFKSYSSVIDTHLICYCMSSGRPCLVSLLFIPSIFPNLLYEVIPGAYEPPERQKEHLTLRYSPERHLNLNANKTFLFMELPYCGKLSQALHECTTMYVRTLRPHRKFPT